MLNKVRGKKLPEHLWSQNYSYDYFIDANEHISCRVLEIRTIFTWISYKPYTNVLVVA